MSRTAVSLVILCLVLQVSFSQYAIPPLYEVHDANIVSTPDPDDAFYADAAVNETVDIKIGGYTRSLQVNASMVISGFSSMVDDVTCPVDGLALILATGYEQEHLASLSTDSQPSFICDHDWFNRISDETAWRCDFDNDYCAEFENRSYVAYNLTASFTIENVSESVVMNSSIIPVPLATLQRIRSAGNTNLTVSVEGDLIFVYEINDRGFAGDDCTSNYVTFETRIPFVINRSFVMGGKDHLFFLRTPVLREQWYRDNHFGVIVLSQSPIYHAELFFNGNLSGNFTFRKFNIEQKEYGLKVVTSNVSGDWGGWRENTTGIITPVPLEQQNRSFAYVYEFSYDYSGLGANEFSLSVNDSCLGEGHFSDRISSRMLSYDGIAMEDGRPIDAKLSRPSAPFTIESLAKVDIAIGIVALMVMVASLNLWLRK